MDRRTYVRAAGTGSVLALGGCLGLASSSADGEPVLQKPDDQRFDSEDLPYPAWGQTLPDFSLPDPLAGTTVDTSTVEETLVVTAFFATCPAECAMLINQLAGVQRETIEEGIGEDVTFLAITFDPERDDETALREYGQRMGVEMDAGNWHFLRPESDQRAKAVVMDKLGIAFERVGADETDRLPGYDFRHLSLTFLRNPGGIVERVYRTERPDRERVLSDARRVVEATA